MSAPAGVTPKRGRLGARTLAVLAVGTAVLATSIDQLTKWWALSEFADGHVVELLPTVELRLVFNPGIAFGLGSEFGFPLVIALMLVLAGLVAWIVVRIRR